MSKNTSQLKTIVIKPEIENIQIGAHFNLWNSDKNKIHCLDIGLMCPIKENKYSVELVVPGCYSQVENLVELIKKDQIACNVFNESIEVSSSPQKFVLLKKEAHQESFLVYDGEIKCCPNKNQSKSLINLIVEKNNFQPDIKNLYFRIRICDFDITSVSACDNSLSRFFVPYCEKSTIFDFRLNDSKLLSVDDGKALQKQNITFSKVHFLLIGDINETVCLCNEKLKIRVFENHNWEDYISKVHSIDKPMIAYHVSNDCVSSASFLLKLQVNKTNALRLSLYTLAVIILSIVANVVYNLICFYCCG